MVALLVAMTRDDTEQAPAPARSRKLAMFALIAACIGLLTFPYGLLLVAWALFVSFVILVTNRRDGRPVPRAVYATFLITVLLGFVCGRTP